MPASSPRISGFVRRERRERLRAAIEQRDERLRVALVAIELRETLGRDLRVGSLSIAIISTRAARCASPSVVDQTFAASASQWLAYAGSRVSLPTLSRSMAYASGPLAGLVRVRQRLFVVRILDEALDEPVDFGADPSRGGYFPFFFPEQLGAVRYFGHPTLS